MNEKQSDIKVYEPDNCLREGYFYIFKNIIIEIHNNLWLIFQLFKRDFLTIYKQSFIGIVWAFIIPFISVGTFIILNESGVLNIGDIKAPYAVYAILGMAFWQLFSTGLIAGSQSLVRAGSMIVKINFSKKSLVIASFGQSFVAFFIQIVLFLVLILIYSSKISWMILFLPFLLLPILFLSLGLSFIVSILNGIMRDVGNIISISMTFLLFLTPVLYPKPLSGILEKLSSFNPIFYLVSVPRDLILFGYSAEIKEYIFYSFISVIIFCICIFIFHLTETRVTERI